MESSRLPKDKTDRPLRQGSATVSDAVLAMAQELVETSCGQVHLLAGVVLADPKTGQGVALDLIAITQAATFVGTESIRDRAHTLTPRAAALVLADLLQREGAIAEPMPVYAFWLGSTAPSKSTDGSPALRDAGAVCRYIQRADTGKALLSEDRVTSLAEGILRQDVGLQGRGRSPARHLRRTLRGLADLPRRIDAILQERIRQPFLFRRSGPILPADVIRHLEKTMLAPKNILESTDYAKIVPNDYVVELNDSNYRLNYAPIERKVCERWEARLLETLNMTNSRWGRKAYRFGGRVRIQIKPAPGLAEGEVRVWCQVSSDVGTMLAVATRACLELEPGGHRWPLREETIIIGRDEDCTICLDMPAVQRARLVSGQHAHIVRSEGDYTLFDGAPGGKPSTNGTFLNGRPVGQDGCKLGDGDVITLASPDPDQAGPDGPAIIALCFHLSWARDQ